jgi:prolyl oligopeptidase
MIRLGAISTVLFALLIVAYVAAAAMADSPSVPAVPATPRKPVAEEYHGVKVVDDYRWLENASDSAVQRWTEEQNQRTRAVLEQYPARAAVRERVHAIMTFQAPSYGALGYSGGKLFALKSQPPRNQPFLVTMPSADDPKSERIILDPNKLDPKGGTAIDFYVPSLDGRLVAVSLSKGGSENGSVQVFETATGKALDDVIPRVNGATAGGSVAWNADASGFYYTRYPRGNERPKVDLDFYQQVYFHKLGTPTEEDTYCIGKEFPRIAEIGLRTSPDGRHVLATVANGDGGEFAHYVLNPDGKWLQLTHFNDQVSGSTFGLDESLYLFSRKDAPRGKILRVALAAPTLAEAKIVVPQSDAVIEGSVLSPTGHTANFVVGPTRLYVVDQIGGPSRIRVFDHDGHQLQTVPTKPVSSVSQLLGTHGDELLFHNESFIDPSAWYRFDPRSSTVTRTALFRRTPVDYSDTEVVREFAVSKDGTQVPINIIYRKGTQRDGQRPTILTGYGGFGLSQSPRYSSLGRIWLDQGGVLAVANLRGGTEYGEAWHKAGSLTHKQNVFDDFAACAQHLIQRRYTSPEKLAIQGGSNGGLLMGAALTQHPELFRAVVARVGIFDMLLHDRHPNGAFNVPEYGTTKDAEQFRALYAYSPYQHVTDGTAYPAVFFMTGANDGRVDPANSRKMTARLQAATSSPRPILLLISSSSGHGIGTGLQEAIDQQTDILVFFFQQLGVNFEAKQGAVR